ncbi:unnamed protein product [Nezara viridula]|uniref:Uncharacterized protein n=1 Tax=Nezara viridula TaxID=85310 RepID=A0A9P0MQL5_NEZVI|nr:unnamed protein product [Nezara viridula]
MDSFNLIYSTCILHICMFLSSGNSLFPPYQSLTARPRGAMTLASEEFGRPLERNVAKCQGGRALADSSIIGINSLPIRRNYSLRVSTSAGEMWSFPPPELGAFRIVFCRLSYCRCGCGQE